MTAHSRRNTRQRSKAHRRESRRLDDSRPHEELNSRPHDENRRASYRPYTGSAAKNASVRAINSEGCSPFLRVLRTPAPPEFVNPLRLTAGNSGGEAQGGPNAIKSYARKPVRGLSLRLARRSRRKTSRPTAPCIAGPLAPCIQVIGCTFQATRNRGSPALLEPGDSRSWANGVYLPGRTQTTAILSIYWFVSSSEPAFLRRWKKRTSGPRRRYACSQGASGHQGQSTPHATNPVP